PAGATISIQYFGGLFPEENYYSVYNGPNGSGTSVFYSGAGQPAYLSSFASGCTSGDPGGGGAGECEISVCLYDTFGDGWNGGSLTVQVGGINVLSNITLTSGGGPLCFNFSVDPGQS